MNLIPIYRVLQVTHTYIPESPTTVIIAVRKAASGDLYLSCMKKTELGIKNELSNLWKVVGAMLPGKFRALQYAEIILHGTPFLNVF